MRILGLWLPSVRVKTSVLVDWQMLTLGSLMLLAALPIQAQNVCINPLFKGDFKVDKPKVCVGSPVNIIAVPNNLSNAGYNFQYDGTSSIDKVVLTQAKSFTYSQPGSYTILQGGSGGGSGTGTIACQVVTVLALDAIKFNVQACQGRRATVTSEPSTLGQYDTYVIRWGDGAVEEKSRAEMLMNPAHTYNSGAPSSPRISVEGIYGTITAPICSSPPTIQPVTLVAAATQPAIIALTTISDNSVEIKYQTSAGVSVQLYQKTNGTYTATGQNGTGAGAFTVQTDAKQVQCFQLVTQDGCTNNTTRSDEVCSLVLDAKAANKQNDLSWQPYSGTLSATTQFRYYRISRNGAPTGGTLTNRNTTTYADANTIICGDSYCYKLEARIQGVAEAVVTSNQVCVNGINGDAPGEVGNVIVSVEDGRPRLITMPPPTIGSTDSFTMLVSRATGASGTFQQVAALDRKSTFTDDNANVSAGSYCYQVVYQTSCGLSSSPSKPVCTIFLESKSSSGIDWNADSPFAPDLIDNYVVEVADSINGSNGAQYPVGKTTRFEPDPNDPNLQQQRYRIIVTSTTGAISYSNFFRFQRDVKIFVPEAFTPNGDGVNDELLAKGIYVDQFTMTIYNRWGEAVYNTSSRTQGWNGTTKGQPAPAGQYMYRIEVIDLKNLKTVRTGAVLLLR